MIAVVTELKEKQYRKKIVVEQLGDITHFKIGSRVGTRKLKRILKPFGNNIVFAKGVPTRGILPFDSEDFKNELLFEMFLRYCTSRSGLSFKVGFIDDDGRFLERFITVVSRVDTATILSKQKLDDYCLKCIAETGACPDIARTKAELYDCDAVFSVNGLIGFTGVLFGKGGRTPNELDVSLPPLYNTLITHGIDALDLAALIFQSKKR